MKRLTLPAFVITLGLAIPVAADSPAELKAKCGAAREARLAPERNQLIEQCVSKEKKDRAVCEKFYRDHGDGGTRGGVRIPRKYDDLPECVAARKPKKAEGETVDGSSGTEDATRKSKKEVKHRDSDDGVNRTRGTEDPTQTSKKKVTNRDSDDGVNRTRGTEDPTRKSKKKVTNRDSDDGVNRTRGTEDPTQKSEK